MRSLYITKDGQKFIKRIKAMGLKFVDWINPHAGEELCRSADGTVYAILRSCECIGTGRDRYVESTFELVELTGVRY